MIRRSLLHLSLALAGTLGMGTSSAQIQEAYLTMGGTTVFDQQYSPCYAAIRFLNQPESTGCDNLGNPRLVHPSTPWGGDYGGLAKYFSLHAGSGTMTIDMDVSFHWNQLYFPNSNPSQQFSASYNAPKQVYVDGQLCTTCTVEELNTTPNPPCNGTAGYYARRLRITHDKGDAWANNGLREFAIRWSYGPMHFQSGAHTDLRFKAIMVGTSYTNVLGYADAPEVPLYILRDPPGDESYASISETSSACAGESDYVTGEESANTWFKARIGVTANVGLIVTTPIEIYGEFGVDLTVSRSETELGEYITCMESNSEYTTPTSGAPDDVFIGSAIRYAYGFGKVIKRTSCGTVVKDAYMCMTPIDAVTSYNYTESYIRDTKIPELQQFVSTLTPGTEAYKTATNQLSVWQQTLALNQTLKADAIPGTVRPFNGDGSGQSYSLTTTTTASRSIEYTSVLDNGISAEFGVFIAGSGVSGGANIRMKKEFGRGQNQTNDTTNTVSYHLEDNDAADNFVVQVKKDPVFGTFAFLLDSAASKTSCKYEGGYKLDQPSLSVGSPGTHTMVLNQVPLSTQAVFPLYVCNTSNVSRTYYLKFNAASNSEGAVLNAFGNQMNSNDNGIQLTVGPNACLSVANLLLTQPSVGVVDFEDIEVYLYSLCEPDIKSSVTLSAYFGTGNGNSGVYCTPTFVYGTSYNDFINGVQLGTINNQNSGSQGGPAYTNYTSSMSATLSRNGQYAVSITSGTWATDRYAAWIDYNKNNTFEASEKLGQFTATAANQANNISFTVPAGATLGTTRMRIRCVDPQTGEPTTLDPCYNYLYGEVEDYAIVINANAPLDCAGVSGGSAVPGSVCNDGNSATGNDRWSASCVCVGQVIDCAGVPGGTQLPGTSCSDGNANTINDVRNASCQCVGVPVNDNVCNAITLLVGTNGTFSNVGSTMQAGEAAPPGTGCATQTGWCSSTVNNSVWFKFVAPASGRVSLNFGATATWDSQIALWSAASCGALLTGGGTLKAANDDIAAAPYHAAILPVCVTPGTTYYVQVDGYNGATNGAFQVMLVEEAPLSISVNVAAAQTLICKGASTNITFTGPAGATITYTVNGGAPQTGVLTGGTLVVSTGALNSQAWYNLVSASQGGCEVALSGSVTVDVKQFDWSNLQWPPTAAITTGGTFTTYGQLYESGLTEAAGAGAGIVAQLGISSTNTDPATWTTWIAAPFNVQVNNNDEYWVTTGSSLTAGTYYYTFRYSYPGCAGVYQYGGFAASGGGPWDGVNNVSGVLSVTVPGDNVCNAIPITVGTNGTYSNVLATTQPGEAVPPTTACSTQVGWCASVISNTMWFSFTAPASGRVSLNFGATATWDSQIALWSAPNCGALLTGGGTLVAANDDIAAAPYHAAILPVCVTPGTTYYVQVDGYGTATNGAFQLVLVQEPGIGSACDDGNPNTSNDVWLAGCICQGTGAGVNVDVRVALEGAYVPADGLMRDNLRTLAGFPLSHPYNVAPFSYAGAESISASLLVTSGNNAIVDWVLVELHSSANPATVVATRAALVQRDGDVVHTTGSGPLLFPGAAAGNYYVAVRHRNHLGAMTFSPVALGTVSTTVDLSLAATATYGSDARKSITGAVPKMALWAGDVSSNGQVKYTGSSNDRDPILVTVGSTTPNSVVSNTYSTRDVNMNGEVKYTGTSNDRDPILVNVGSTTPNNVRIQQLP